MKQCPKCNKTYANDKQKFCTKDGSALVDAHEALAGQDATIRIDSAQLDDEITKVISQQLPQMSGSAFDPYKTQVSTEQEKAPSTPPPPSQPVAPPPPAAAPPTPAAAPAPPEPTPPVSVSSSSAPATPQPSYRMAKTIASPPPDTANFAAQSTNASIPADTASRVTAPAPPTAPVPQTGFVPAAPQPAITQPRKRSKLPWILGILFVLLLIGAGGLVAGYFFVLKPMIEKKGLVMVEPRGPEPTPMVASTPDIGITKPEAPKVEVPPYAPPADAVQFVNSNAKLDGKLADHYVDFSFYYPRTWQKDPRAGTSGASNFAKVERRLPPDFTQENFAVGWYSSTGSEDGDRVVFPTLADNLSKQFAKSFTEYKKVSEGPTKAGVYQGYEFRFESASRNTEHGDIKIWGRVIFVPPVDGSSNGVTLLMLTTSLAPEIRSVGDVGIRGELPMMLESFRFGK